MQNDCLKEDIRRFLKVVLCILMKTVRLYKFNKVELFNGESSLPQNWWIDVGPTPSANDSGVKGICHDIYGTDGTMFPPFVESGTTLWIFVAELCRSIWLEYTEDVEVRIISTIYVGAISKVAKILRSVYF